MTAAAELVARLLARGVTLEADQPDLVVRPADAVSPDEVAALRRHKAEVIALLNADAAESADALASASADLIASYRHVLGRLWLLNIPPPTGVVGVAEGRALRAEQARLCDELGPEFAFAVSRHHARAWSRTMNRCPWCGLAGVFHDPDSGQELAL